MYDSLPDIETLRRCFRLDRSTGKLYWRERPVEHFAHGAADALALWAGAYMAERWVAVMVLATAAGGAWLKEARRP